MRGLRWRYFWSRRSRTRTVFALALALVGLLLAIYLVLPQSAQTLVIEDLGVAGQTLATLGTTPLLGIALAVCALASIAFIYFPTYRNHTYLTTAPSIIPPVSVYLDAENQLPTAAIASFMRFLIEHLDGRRTDLLYFLDASASATRDKYKELYRFGFRPIDVPHDPTGERRIKEAVDKELAMHALERALLGPPHQEFIIVTGDQDFVHLVYRLAALGHRVQVWATPMRQAYRTLATYLDVGLLDLTQVVSELETSRREQLTNDEDLASSLNVASSFDPHEAGALNDVSQGMLADAGERIFSASSATLLELLSKVPKERVARAAVFTDCSVG